MTWQAACRGFAPIAAGTRAARPRKQLALEGETMKRKNSDTPIADMMYNIFKAARSAETHAENAGDILAIADWTNMKERQQLVDILEGAADELTRALQTLLAARSWVDIICQDGNAELPEMEKSTAPYKSGCKNYGDAWVNWALFKAPVDPEALEKYQEMPSYAGPGQVYAKRANVRTVGRRVLLTQQCGMDI